MPPATRNWLLSRASFAAVFSGGVAVAIGAVAWRAEQVVAGEFLPALRVATGIVCGLFLLQPAVHFAGPPVLALVAWALKRRHTTAYPCPECGYDIRMSPHRCPECGTELAWGFRKYGP